MPFETATLCKGIPASRTFPLAGLFVIASGLFSGCVSPDAFSAALRRKDAALENRSLIRSQDVSADDAWSREDRASTVNAEYGSLQSRYAGRSDQATAEILLVDGGTATGHSFLQPKGRLGRPVFLPETQSRTSHAGQELSRDTSPALVKSDQLPEVASRSPWPQEGSAGWQPIAKGTSTWLRAEDEASGGTTGDGPQVVEDTERPEAAADEGVSTLPSSVNAMNSIEVGVTQPMLENAETVASEVLPEAAVELNPEDVPQQESSIRPISRTAFTIAVSSDFSAYRNSLSA